MGRVVYKPYSGPSAALDLHALSMLLICTLYRYCWIGLGLVMEGFTKGRTLEGIPPWMSLKFHTQAMNKLLY